jgi:hypothetical protein
MNPADFVFRGEMVRTVLRAKMNTGDEVCRGKMAKTVPRATRLAATFKPLPVEPYHTPLPVEHVLKAPPIGGYPLTRCSNLVATTTTNKWDRLVVFYLSIGEETYKNQHFMVSELKVQY